MVKRKTAHIKEHAVHHCICTWCLCRNTDLYM